MNGASHRPRKRFGQNFLHDEMVIDRIVRAVDPRPGDRLVEIGPGLGALTRPLLRAAGRLDAIEIDRDLIPLLQQHCAGLGELRLHHLDVLNCDLSLLAEGKPLRLVGNLPYNISTPLIFHLLRQLTLIRDMHFMVQKEVAERMAAAPGTPSYGRLGVMVQLHCTVDILFNVGAGAFKPAPKVESAVVRLAPHARPPVYVNDPSRFAEVVRTAFNQRRKTLRNALKGRLTAEQMIDLGIDPGRRPETLTLAEFAGLSNAAGEDAKR
jgi:16S rRNA (adenine1518-N6/adenine1519-N6)-dimethyltransferase